MMTAQNRINAYQDQINSDDANLIDWFSQTLIRPLDEQMITIYRSEKMLQFIADLGEELKCQEVATTLCKQLIENDVKDVQHHLNWSYTMMFDGVSGPKTISLYESGYFGDGTRLFQQPFVDMQAILQELDVSVGENCKEPADHIALELAAFAEAIRQENDEIIVGLYQRLMRWLPKLIEDVSQMQFGGFYHNVLFLLDAYLTLFYSNSSENFDAGFKNNN